MTNEPEATRQARECTRKSQIALGMACICVVFLLETITAHQRLPNPASPWVWALLSAAALAGFAAWAWLRAKARRLAKLKA